MGFYRKFQVLFKSKEMVKFDNLVQVAYEIKNINPLALYHFINLILKPMQSEVNLVTAESGSGIVKEVKLAHLFSEEIEHYLNESKNINIKPKTENTTLHLASDIAFTRPWNRQRYIENLCYLASHQLEITPINWKEDYNQIGRASCRERV